MISEQNSKSYYDGNYVNNQIKVAVDNIPIYKRVFKPHSTKEMIVLDYGCGTGILLSVLNAKYKIGIDINETALKIAKKGGINEVHSDLDNIESNSVDLIVSNSALEHVPNPHQVLSRLNELLKQDGKIIFRVPHETIGWAYKSGDWNYHLYTWSPMAIGNLFNDTGFSDIKVKTEKSIRPPLNNFFKKFFLEKKIGYLYRIFRMILDDFSLLRIGVDGYSIISAKK
jgi:SAM-dependent methyltransferase